MIIIADSGSTKTDWTWVKDGEVVERITTMGINPVHMDEDMIAGIIREGVPSVDDARLGDDGLEGVFFYGAGCISPHQEKVTHALQSYLPNVTVEVESDMLGAARAVCGREEGIACILGTGANSCLYDGEQMTGNVPPLGYILGDEGSGAVLGKLFLNALFKGDLPQEMKEDYLNSEGLTYADVIRKVYREPLANRFLASTSFYIYNHLEDERIRELVKENFRQFFRKNVDQYNRKDLKVGAIGSVAFVYHDCLLEVAQEMGYVMEKIWKSPMEGLIKYHDLKDFNKGKRKSIG